MKTAPLWALLLVTGGCSVEKGPFTAYEYPMAFGPSVTVVVKTETGEVTGIFATDSVVGTIWPGAAEIVAAELRDSDRTRVTVSNQANSKSKGKDKDDDDSDDDSSDDD